ncbi:MAG: hypothetical protein ACLRTQ_08210 [Candidatus Borkfalkia sp.]
MFRRLPDTSINDRVIGQRARVGRYDLIINLLVLICVSAMGYSSPCCFAAFLAARFARLHGVDFFAVFGSVCPLAGIDFFAVFSSVCFSAGIDFFAVFGSVCPSAGIDFFAVFGSVCPSAGIDFFTVLFL